MGRRFKIIMQYDGSNYCGWQRQRYQPSVQAKIENALQPLNQNQPVTVIAAGRTDSGVHARRQTAHFDLVTDLSPETIRKALNATLPDDIYIDYCQEVGKEFHARFTAINRTYHYQVVVKPDVFLRKYVWLVNFRFDLELLQECAKLVKG
ncbi:MAG TPA: tRNA pseudouridine(38-40) synthase TruA, partial [Candidatus Marinimicrobia bacterium]|nr:tRNA pseudouridine(38-40) synthase TruA [Candidatus Neomarinimicrobiota bacterium]